MATLTLNVSTIEGCTKLKYNFSLEKEAGESFNGYLDYGQIQNVTTGTNYTVDSECSEIETVLTTNTSTLVEGYTTIDVSCLQLNGNPAGLTTLPDGLFCIEITMSYGLILPISQTAKYLNLCEVCCKVKQLAAQVDVFCNCDPDLNKFMSAYGLLKALQYTGLCSSDAYINKALKNLQNFLSNTKCKTC